jgi:membrane fusion protein (multidrug efflux system)
MASPEHRPGETPSHAGITGQPGPTSPPPAGQHAAAPPAAPPPATSPPANPRRKWIRLGALAVIIVLAAYFLIPAIITMLTTVSTDDAYVNGHVTFAAPRVAGQVKKVFVDDNYRVKKGDILVQLDKEPFEVQLALKQAVLATAEADLVAAEAQVRADVAEARANRFKLDHTMEDVNNQIATLRANVESLKNRQATLVLAKANLKRGEDLAPSGGISKEDLDVRRQTVKQDEALVEQALQTVYANRAALGLPTKPPEGKQLGDVPEDLAQTYSQVRQAVAALMQSAARFGYSAGSWNSTPKEVIAEFYRQDPTGSFDTIIAKLIPKAPAIQQARAKVDQAREDVRQAKLNLSYCDIVSDIDGVVTSRSVNPGNYVQVGQSLMAVRSLTEIWIDANFKETQLADLRIGQRVRCDVDMYGSRREYEGRITGFTMGTGQTLALLPPQNATGNFVKIVQRLPVRIELTNYDPDEETLFVGLSVEPHVYYKEKPEGPNAGKRLQQATPLPTAEPYPRP